MPARKTKAKRPKATRKAAKTPRKSAKRTRARSGAGSRTRPPIEVPPGWSLDRGGKSISLSLRAKDFVEALDIVNAVGALAEELEHHPDLHLERWNRLTIRTWSHDVGGLTERDARLATRVNELLQRRSLHAHATA